jgi:hypothetical protein
MCAPASEQGAGFFLVRSVVGPPPTMLNVDLKSQSMKQLRHLAQLRDASAKV